MSLPRAPSQPERQPTQTWVRPSSSVWRCTTQLRRWRDLRPNTSPTESRKKSRTLTRQRTHSTEGAAVSPRRMHSMVPRSGWTPGLLPGPVSAVLGLRPGATHSSGATQHQEPVDAGAVRPLPPPTGPTVFAQRGGHMPLPRATSWMTDPYHEEAPSISRGEGEVTGQRRRFPQGRPAARDSETAPLP